MLRNKIISKRVLENILLIYKHEGCDACDVVASILKRYGLKYRRHSREKVTDSDFDDNPFVIIVGGDGTVLRVTNRIRNDSIVLCVNSAPKTTEGFLCRTRVDDFESKLRKIISGRFKINLLPRLRVLINDKPIEGLALNEVSISPHKPYQTMIYNLNKSIEKSSGIIVTTPIGSTGWCKSAGGKTMRRSSKNMQYVIREPYHGKIYKVKKNFGIVNDFAVQSISEGIIVFDSIHTEIDYKRGDIIKVGYSSKPLKFVEF